MTPMEIRPDRSAWLALGDVERATNSPEVARAAIAYVPATDRTRRIILAVVGVLLLLVPLAECITETATHSRGWLQIDPSDRSASWFIEAVALSLIFAAVVAVTRLPGRSLRRQVPDWLAIVVAAPARDMSESVDVRAPRWWFRAAGILLVGYLEGTGIWDPARPLGRNFLALGVCVAIFTVVAAAIWWPLSGQQVLRLTPDGMVSWSAPGKRAHPDERIVLPWWQISGVTPEDDAVVIATNSCVPTEHRRRARRHRSPLQGPQSVPGGYRIVLTGTGVRPETVCWAAEAFARQSQPIACEPRLSAAP